MEALEITQEKFDSIVIGIAQHQVNLASIAASMRMQDDPDAWRREEENIMLMNILDALKNYDLESGIITDKEIYYNYELVTLISESCS